MEDGTNSSKACARNQVKPDTDRSERNWLNIFVNNIDKHWMSRSKRLFRNIQSVATVMFDHNVQFWRRFNYLQRSVYCNEWQSKEKETKTKFVNIRRSRLQIKCACVCMDDNSGFRNFTRNRASDFLLVQSAHTEHRLQKTYVIERNCKFDIFRNKWRAWFL